MDWDLLTIAIDTNPDLVPGQSLNTPLSLKDGGCFWHEYPVTVSEVRQLEDRTEVEVWCGLERLGPGLIWHLVPDTRTLWQRACRKQAVMAYVPHQPSPRGLIPALLQSLVNFLQKEENDKDC
jgi:hypothetical protein